MVQIILQNLANAVSLGSLYALIAIGYTMVYGIIRLINFAHGDVFMFSLYVVYYGVAMFFLPWPLAVLVSIILTVVMGVTIERFAYRPLRTSPKLSVLISAIAVSFFLESLATVIFGGLPKSFPAPDFFNIVNTVGGVAIPNVTIVIPIVALACLAGLVYVIEHTKTGMAMRAVSRDYTASRLMAIDVDKIVTLTFVIGSALAAIGGVLWGIRYTQIVPLMGVMPGLKCFIAAVIGGIGNIKGAMLGGFLLGFLEIFLVGLMPSLTGYRDAFAFIALILILLVRPQGLLGAQVTDKV
jgi:branched-chain amino acid transport system permease protein